MDPERNPVNIMLYGGKIQFGDAVAGRVCSNVQINDNAWKTISVTQTGVVDQGIFDKFDVFVNGSKTDLCISGQNRTSSRFLMGARLHGTSYELYGNYEISHALFYDRILSEQEIEDYHILMSDLQ
jgi:hypothetical protein